MQDLTNIKDVTFDYIVDYVKGKGKADIQWLKEVANKPVAPDKNGKERKISFIEIRKEFVIKYLPHLAPKPKEKKPTMWERIADL
jgi:hypothetical protein